MNTLVRTISALIILFFYSFSSSLHADDGVVSDILIDRIYKDMHEKYQCEKEQVKVTCLSGTNDLGGYYSFVRFCSDYGVEACGNRFNYIAIGGSFEVSALRLAKDDGGFIVKAGKYNAAVIQGYEDLVTERHEAEMKRREEMKFRQEMMDRW